MDKPLEPEEEVFWRSFRYLSFALREGFDDPVLFPAGIRTVAHLSSLMLEFFHLWVQDSRPLESYHIAAAVVLFDFWKGREYGDSWCKRGESLSIFGNLSRKFDRLDNHFTRGYDLSDLAKMDAVIDLGVYCIKYGTWLAGRDLVPFFQILHNLAQETFEKEFASAQNENTEDAEERRRLRGEGEGEGGATPSTAGLSHIPGSAEVDEENRED